MSILYKYYKVCYNVLKVSYSLILLLRQISFIQKLYAMTDKITQDSMLSTEGQLKQIKRFIEDGGNSITIEDLKNLGLTKDVAQEVIKSGDKLHEIMRDAALNAIKKLAIIDARFGAALTEFDLIVPVDYNHDTIIDDQKKKLKKLKNTYYYNDELTSNNFANATNKLVPGKTYRVKIFPILEGVTSEDCMTFLKKQRAILVGGQGVLLANDLKGDEFPIGKWTVSFDEKEALWKDSDGCHGVPVVYRHSGGDREFHLGVFEGDWDGGGCLVCFCDK